MIVALLSISLLSACNITDVGQAISGDKAYEGVIINKTNFSRELKINPTVEGFSQEYVVRANDHIQLNLVTGNYTLFQRSVNTGESWHMVGTIKVPDADCVVEVDLANGYTKCVSWVKTIGR